jgi:OOP family OmpA-OmpF porin
MKFNTIIIATLLAGISLSTFAQEEESVLDTPRDPLEGLSYKKRLKYADEAFEYGNYFQALDLYKSFLEERPGSNQLYYKIGYCYMEARDYKSAEKYLSQAIESGNTDAQTYYYKALMLNQQGKYDAAQSTYSKAMQKGESPWSEWAKKKRKACDFAKEQVKDSVNYKITHLEQPINGPYTDYAPKVFNQNLYYSSLNTDSILNQQFYRENKKHYSRIYMSTKLGDNWVQGEPLSYPINGSDFHSGNYALTSDGNRVYFTKCQDEGNANVTCKIYQSTKKGGIWSEPIELGSGVNASKANNTHPAVAEGEDFDILYFSSDRDNGQGGYDIYSAEVGENGKISNVQNLGATINTSGDEKTPFYNAQKELLYFTSNLHLGLGGFDNFSTEKTEEGWATPVNLGYPINSSADDQFYATGENKKTYYFVSNRPGIIGLKSETCCDDIFKAKDLFIPVFAVEGNLLEQVDSNTTKPLQGVTIAVYDVTNGSRTLVSMDTVSSDSYIRPLKAERKYEVEYKKPGYFAINKDISTMGIEESDTFSTDVAFEKIRKDKSYTLSNIYYAYNSSELNEDSKETLDLLYTILQDNESLVFELSSHTDSIGSKGYNERLSQKRAQACVDYLLEKGISEDQLIAKGYGESKPIAPNTSSDGTDNPEGRAKNRRTEYRIIGELDHKGDEIIFDGNDPIVE